MDEKPELALLLADLPPEHVHAHSEKADHIDGLRIGIYKRRENLCQDMFVHIAEKLLVQ